MKTGAVIGATMPDFRVKLLADLAQQVEVDGYDMLLTPESWTTESFAAVTAMALVTERLRVGTAILPIANRSAPLTAMGATTVDDLSGGRFVLGLGMGHRSITMGWHGVAEFNPRLSWLREYVTEVRRILAGGETPAGYRLGLPPAHEIPIYLAALRPGAMRLAGEIADGVLLYLLPHARVSAAADSVRAGATASGRDPGAVEVCLSVSACVTDDPEPVRAAARTVIAWYANFPFYNEMFAEAGFAAEAEALTAAWERVRQRDPEQRGWVSLSDEGTASLVSDEMVDAIFVIGDAETCRARVGEIRGLGIDRALIYPFGPYADAEAAVAGYAATLAGCAGA